MPTSTTRPTKWTAASLPPAPWPDHLYRASVSGVIPPEVLPEIDGLRDVEQEVSTVLRIRVSPGVGLARRLAALRARGVQLLDVRRRRCPTTSRDDAGAGR
jgi:hypothetical protein